MKKKMICLTVIACILLAGCTDVGMKDTAETVEKITKEVADQAANIADRQDSHVLGVKNGYPVDHPDQTYGDAFEGFFSYPTWKYFIGTKEGSDEDGDGRPDYEEEEVDIVEFTGYCMYQETEVKALIQFTLDGDEDTFEATYLSFNDVPQNMLVLYSLLDVVFTEDETDGTTADTELQDNGTETGEAQEDGIYTTEEEWMGSYSRENGPACGISIWSEDEDGIMFAMGIGGSGYLAYVDLRDCMAEWTGENTAVYTEEYDGRHYSLTFTLQEDGFLTLSENVPFNEDFPLAGVYIPNDIAEDNCEFVFPEDNVFHIDTSELEGKTAAECRIARNEIFARHGRRFDDEQLQNYFDTCSWYEGTVAPEDFSDSILNKVEKENLQIISDYETRMGY